MKNRRSGFTLLEIVLVIVLIGIVTTVAYSVFFTGQKSFEVGVDKVEEQADYRILREQLVKEFRYINYFEKDPPDADKYYSLKLDNNKPNQLEKTEYKNGKPEAPTYIPLRFNSLEIEIINGKMVVELKTYTKYKFTILLENNKLLNSESLKPDIDRIFYTYPEYLSIKGEGSDGEESGDPTIPEVSEIKDLIPGKTYHKGDKVIYDGKEFISVTSPNTWTPGVAHSTWNEITEKWRSFNLYNIGDKVLYEKDNRWYRCKVNGTVHHTPPSAPSAWELIE